MVYVGPPDFEARCEILRIRMRRMSAGDVDVEVVARMADGFSGAEVVAICQEAAMLAMEEDVHAEKVEQKHFEEGVRLITPSITKKVLAFYEEFGSRSGPE
jgi:SpoVK/Ycf46/Vps4 family AAA+-type ATPase